MNVRRLIEKLTFRSRERDVAGATDQHVGGYRDETTLARVQPGLDGAGAPPPGYVNEYEKGRPRK